MVIEDEDLETNENTTTFNEVSIEHDDHMDYENNEITTISDTDNDFVQNNDNEINESTSTVAYEVFDEITTEKMTYSSFYMNVV